MNGSVLWAEAPDDDDGREETSEPETQAHVDETFAARRLRRWIKGMFGGKPPAAEPEEPGREQPES